MVHALTQAHRVLRPGGYVVEYRPERDPSGTRVKALPLYCVAGRAYQYVGDLVETDEFYSDYVAAGRALRRILAKELFVLEASETMHPRVHFQTLEVLERYLDKEWTGTTMSPAVRRRARDLLRRYPGSHLAVREFFIVNVLRKSPPPTSGAV